MINTAFVLTYLLRFRSGLVDNALEVTATGLFFAGLILTLMWILLFTFFGLYKSKFAISRLDEIITLFKAVTVGTLILFIQSFDIRNPLPPTRFVLYNYWALMIVLASMGRIVIRTWEKKRLKRGIGHRNTLIVGAGDKAFEVKRKTVLHPALGLRIIGFIQMKKKVHPEIETGEIFGTVREIRSCIHSKDIEEIIIAVENSKSSEIAAIIDQCDSEPVNIRAVSDIYDIASGRSRTKNILGIPFVEIFPDRLKPWERYVKRLIDFTVSFLILFVFLPLWVIIALLIKLSSQDPVFYKQKRVGFKGKVFTMYKFRSMIKDAEKHTGPVLVEGKDTRITVIGKILRRPHLDEIPQFINVLEGDMSLVGPRPERPYLVEKFKDKIPLYSRRLSVRPGITGWAQIKQSYESSIKDVTKKLEYDLFYIENMSLQLDLSILLRTAVIMIKGKGK